MLILIHGDDLVASRKALDQEKNRAEAEKREIVNLDGRKVEASDVVTAVSSVSFFDSGKTVVIENFFKSGTTKEKEKILSYLGKEKNLPEVIFWEEKELEKTKIKKFLPKAKVIYCSLPKLLFQFLEAIGGKPPSLLIPIFWKLLKQKDMEFIFVMILRQLRFLIIAKDMGERGLRHLSPWQARKFISQSRHFKVDKLILAYRKLLSLEYKLKTGQTAYTFERLIDIFLVNL